MATANALDRYRDLKVLGSGGMGTVTLAQDTMLGRQVALKRLHTAGDPRGISRLRREALVGASLSHPNLVSVYDVLTHEDGDLVVVMEYVPGGTLRDAIRGRSGMPVEQSMRVLEGVAAGLDAIHERGIVHRDIKPANILLGTHGTIKLADLGVASVADRTQITTDGAVLGTFSYMAPEQLEGANSEPAMDIYALSAVAYEMFSGHKARPEPNPLALAHAISTQPAPDLREVWQEAPAATAEVLLRGMARDVTERPRSAGELVSRLRESFEPQTTSPTRARPMHPPAPLPPAPADAEPADQAPQPPVTPPSDPAPSPPESRTRESAPVTPAAAAAAATAAAAGAAAASPGVGERPAALDAPMIDEPRPSAASPATEQQPLTPAPPADPPGAAAGATQTPAESPVEDARASAPARAPERSPQAGAPAPERFPERNVAAAPVPAAASRSAARRQDPPASPPAGASRRRAALLGGLLALAAAIIAVVIVSANSGGGSPHGVAKPTPTGRASSSRGPAAKKPTSPAPGAAAPAPTPFTVPGSTIPQPTTPVAAVEAFYGLATQHRYAQAWQLADPAAQAQVNGYRSFVAQQSATRSIRFNRIGASGQGTSATVSVQTTSVRTDGSHACSGAVSVVNAGGTWRVHGFLGINCT